MVQYKCLSKAVAEFLGTFMLMAAFTNVTVNGNALGALAVASALMIGIYSLGSVSGAHFNPAVSFAVLIMHFVGWVKDFGIGEFLVYVCSQLAGAGCSALLNTLLWTPHHNVGVPAGQVAKGAGNETHPWRNHVIEDNMKANGAISVLGSECLYTFVLVFVILNVATCNDAGPNNWYFGLAIGMVIVAAASAVGGISFCCLNPAVSFGTTLMNSIYAMYDTVNEASALGDWFAYTGFELLGALIACAMFMVCRSHMVPKKKGKEAGMCSKLLAEFLGTFVLCLTVHLVCNQPSDIGAIGIACSLMVMIYALGAVSGANFNPAVSFGLLLDGELPCVNFVLYVIAQLAGAIFALFCAWCVLKELKVALVVHHATGEVGGAAGGDWYAVLMAELIFTAMLVFTVLNVAVYDGGNQYYGLAIGFVIIVGAASVGSVSGGCFNPAVAVSLDLAAWVAGNGAQYGWSWLYFLFQMIAAAIAFALTKAVRCTHGHSSSGSEKDLDEDEEEEEEDYQ